MHFSKVIYFVGIWAIYEWAYPSTPWMCRVCACVYVMYKLLYWWNLEYEQYMRFAYPFTPWMCVYVHVHVHVSMSCAYYVCMCMCLCHVYTMFACECVYVMYILCLHVNVSMSCTYYVCMWMCLHNHEHICICMWVCIPSAHKLQLQLKDRIIIYYTMSHLPPMWNNRIQISFIGYVFFLGGFVFGLFDHIALIQIL